LDDGRSAADWIASTSFSAGEGFSEKDALASGSFRLCHEHHHAIMQLIESGHAGSAFALLRPCFEALSRGIWCRDRAGLDAIEHFKSGQDTKPPDRLLREGSAPSNKQRVEHLKKLWKVSKSALHGYTHGGYRLILDRHDANSMPSLIVARAIRFATQTALMSTYEIAVTFGNAENIARDALLRIYRLVDPDDEVQRIMKDNGLA